MFRRLFSLVIVKTDGSFAALVPTLRIGAGDLVGEEDPGGHAGEDHDEERQQLEVAGQDARALGVRQVAAGEGALHDHLVAAPVPGQRGDIQYIC